MLYGKHDYNANPFTILGSAVEAHVMPNKRKTFEAHTKAGFYLGNSWEHYRCHEVWIVDTKSVRVGQTVFFKHKYITQPALTPTDTILRASDDLAQILKGVLPVKGDTRTTVDLLMEIFKNVEKRETPVDAQ